MVGNAERRENVARHLLDSHEGPQGKSDDGHDRWSAGGAAQLGRNSYRFEQLQRDEFALRALKKGRLCL